MSQFEPAAGRNEGERRSREPSEAPEPGERARTESELLPAEAFSLLGNETRVGILRALSELGGDGEPASFTELFERVDIDDSANFSYHLDRLTGHFLRRTEAGYEFRHPGRKVVAAMVAGSLTERAQVGFFPVEGACYDCDGDLHGWYVDDTLRIGCADCGAVQASYPFPPGGLEERSAEELLSAFNHYVRHHYCLAADGVCPECTGAVESTVVREPDADDLDLAVEHACERCGHRLRSSVGVALLDEVAVLDFHARRGVDLSSAPFWRFDWCVSDEHTEVVAEEPLRVAVTIACEGDELRVVLDGSLSVVETTVVERRSASGDGAADGD